MQLEKIENDFDLIYTQSKVVHQIHETHRFDIKKSYYF